MYIIINLKSINIKYYNLKSILVHMFQSSTPDGLAPIGTIALIAFIGSISGLAMLWGIINLFFLLRFIPEGQNSQKMQRVFEVNRKLLRGTIDITKFNILIGLAATLIFFLLIMGTVQNFNTFYYSTSYLLGALNSIIIAVFSSVICVLVIPRIINYARFSVYDSFDAAKKAANFQSYFMIGWTILVMGLFLVFYHRKYSKQLTKPQQIVRVAKMLVSFSFGSATISIGTRIINSIYAKGADYAVQSLAHVDDKLRKDHKHPALICKALGQIINKGLSTVLDSVSYLCAGIGVGVYAGSYNIIGTDQQGQIIFQYSIDNCYLPILSVLFSLFYNLLFNVALSLVMRPSTGQGVRTYLNLQRYTTTFLMIGFQALAAYLCLPAQFFISQLGPYVRHPYHAYLCLLFGLLVCVVVSTIAQILSTHPFFLNSISNSCKTGAATNIIYGLSFGYMFNFIPILAICGTLFLADYWLGAYGIGLIVIGFLTLLPHYVYGSLIYSYLQNASYIAYLAQIDQSIIQSMVDATKTRKDYQPHINYYYNAIICYFGFQAILVFINSAAYKETTSLRSPLIFLGLLVGAMFPYFFDACLIRSIYKSAPAILYDMKMQIQEIPAMANGNMDPDFVRTSSLYGFQCVLSLKRFIPVLFGPIVVIGIAGGPQLVIGFLCGTVISGIQLSLSSGMSGNAWTTVKKQITFNNIQDQQGNVVKADSQWGKAADVGYSVGLPLKDCVAPSTPIMLTYWGLQAFVFATLYSNIHPSQ